MSGEERGRTSRAEWAKRVERWRESGLSAAQFAGEIGINPRTLTYWKWVLGKEARGERPQTQNNRSEATSSFVEVRATPSSAAFELVLGNGRRLQIPAAFDASTLERLLAVLERK